MVTVLQGFDNVNNILSSAGDYAPGLLIQIVVMKIIATSICRGSGLQGGIYAPSIFIGAALGSAFGEFAHAVGDPTGLLLSAPQAYALVGRFAFVLLLFFYVFFCGIVLYSEIYYIFLKKQQL